MVPCSHFHAKYLKFYAGNTSTEQQTIKSDVCAVKIARSYESDLPERLMYSNLINFNLSTKHLKPWKHMLCLKWGHKFFMPFLITPSIMWWEGGRPSEGLYTIISFALWSDHVIFHSVSVTERSHHKYQFVCEFHLNLTLVHIFPWQNVRVCVVSFNVVVNTHTVGQ